MDFFDKHKALIITSLLFLVILLSLYNFNLSSNNREVSEMLVDLEQFKQQEKKDKPQPAQEQPKQKDRTIKTHRAYNQDKEARESDFNNKLTEIFEKNSADQKAENETSENETGNYAVNKKNSETNKSQSDGDDSSEETSQKSAIYDHSSISFSLKGRSAVKIPNPVYTCDTAGKIVINIEVNANGNVLKTSFSKAASTSNNECLVEQALEYARGARFTKLPGRNSQPGTITYHFKP